VVLQSYEWHQQGHKNTDINKIHKKYDKKKRDFKFATVKGALEGMTEDRIKKHKEVKANCWRCGRQGHFILECNAKKTEGWEDIVKAAVSSAKKRGREDNEASKFGEKGQSISHKGDYSRRRITNLGSIFSQ
jgi:hypothetical protein